ncbi:uncharacterized protein LOC6603049 isoform X1 [Drosophila persimilis]|uniref:uncharacterized protein LOC6603049 isoform X1 n=1 Tax=Drosophila persimilis TaxID=7234 RepID=UPI000F0734BB|nr:uncharacterized protein LOC6603049 isoform X1 [Drosophila persimilis]XP_026843773.1 uncharacterized protein LOC6603049 isoform X1 [Drosophila persimilis]
MPAVAAGMAGGRPCAPPASEDRTAINSVLRATISNAKEAPSPTLLSISPPTHGPRATRRRRRGSDADGRTLIYNLQIKETKDLEFHMRCAEHAISHLCRHAIDGTYDTPMRRGIKTWDPGKTNYLGDVYEALLGVFGNRPFTSHQHALTEPRSPLEPSAFPNFRPADKSLSWLRKRRSLKST